MKRLTKDQLRNMIKKLTDAFNRDDLDSVMKFFAENATYVEFTGKTNRGKTAIRKAFEPQFRGDFGEVRFKDKDFVIDEKSQKAVFNWWCTMSLGDESFRWEGLDVFNLENGLILEKRTFAQADLPRFVPRNLSLLPKFLVYVGYHKIRNLW